MKDRVIVENTIYSLFFYIISDKDWYKRDYIIYNERIPQGFIKRMKERCHFVKEVNSINKNKKNKLYTLIKTIKNIFVQYKIQRFIIENYHSVYGNYDLHALRGLKKNINRICIEDGEHTRDMLYKNHDEFFNIYTTSNAKIIRYLYQFFLNYKPLDFQDLTFLISKNYDAGLFHFRPCMNKILTIDMVSSWNSLTDNQKQKILDLFEIDYEIIKNLQNSILLLTQPLSEDGICSEDEKIALYKDIISENYTNKINFCIKPHPTEKTNYKKIFKTITILNSNFPVEILSLLNIKFHIALTVFSSAMNMINAEKKIIYGTENYPFLKVYFPIEQQIII